MGFLRTVFDAALLRWELMASMALHGALFLFPEHFFLSPPRHVPITEIRMLVEVAPPAPQPPSAPQERPETPPLPVSTRPDPEPTTLPEPPEPEPETTVISQPEPPEPTLAPIAVQQPKAAPLRPGKPKPKPKSVVRTRPKPPKPKAPRQPKPAATPEPVPPAQASTDPQPSPNGSSVAPNASTRGDKAAVASPPAEVVFGSDQGPTFKRRVRTRYPRTAARSGRGGTVVLRLTIDSRGRLNNIEVVTSAGQDLDEAAIRAVRASTFHPAMQGGLPVASRAILPIRFKLKE